MAKSLHVRLDDASEAALALISQGGITDSEAVRTALTEAADRRRKRSALAAEAAALAADEIDRVEIRAIQDHLDEFSSDWPID